MRYYNVFVSNGDDDKVFTLITDYTDLSEVYLSAELKFSELGFTRPWFITSVCPQRGGYRPGSGKKSEGKPPKTTPKRVPTEWADKIHEIDLLLGLIQDWRDREKEASQTSPRWERMREFLKEVGDLGL